MTAEKWAELHRLRPFRIYFEDGGHAEVRHPEMLASAPSGRTAVPYSPDERFRIID